MHTGEGAPTSAERVAPRESDGHSSSPKKLGTDLRVQCQGLV